MRPQRRPGVAERCADHVLVLTPPALARALPADDRRIPRGRPTDVRVLSSLNGVVRLERVDDGASCCAPTARVADEPLRRAAAHAWPAAGGAGVRPGPLPRHVARADARSTGCAGGRFRAGSLAVGPRPALPVLGWHVVPAVGPRGAAAGEPVVLADTSDVWPGCGSRAPRVRTKRLLRAGPRPPLAALDTLRTTSHPFHQPGFVSRLATARLCAVGTRAVSDAASPDFGRQPLGETRWARAGRAEDATGVDRYRVDGTGRSAG